MMSKKVVIIGAGISGLTSALALKKAQPTWSITVVDKEQRAGGKLGTSLVQGLTVEHAANGFLDNAPETLALIQELGLEAHLLRATPAAQTRYVFHEGGLRPLPLSPATFLKSDLLSPAAKLRAAREPFIAPSEHEQTVFDFIARRFGAGFARVLAPLLVMGITAGDPHELSFDALFPRLRGLERCHRSLLRGMIAAQKAARRAGQQSPRLSTLRGGLKTLISALSDKLTDHLMLGTAVSALEQTPQGWNVTYANGTQHHADVVMLATPAYVSAELLRNALPEAAAELSQIAFADVQVWGLGFSRLDVPHTLEAFGFLVPRSVSNARDGLRILGVQFESSIFDDMRAPEGLVNLRVITGGRPDPEFASLSDEEGLEVVRRDLRVTLGIMADPEVSYALRWPQGIAQYGLGHEARMTRLINLTHSHRVLLMGSSYYGVSVNDNIRDAHRFVKLLAEI